MGKPKGEIELARVTAVEAVDMEALSRGLFFQVRRLYILSLIKNMYSIICKNTYTIVFSAGR